ncbi:hypothetical protein BLGI_4011 [Brevibacillus laterosporus GI-9]|nr:hypothetical protein BLGI_4011 [Brevibacillus laterosporus GI-9]
MNKKKTAYDIVMAIFVIKNYVDLQFVAPYYFGSFLMKKESRIITALIANSQ